MSDLLRLIYPQWQGGNRIQYAAGTRLLEWLSPDSSCETVEIPVSMEPEQEYPACPDTQYFVRIKRKMSGTSRSFWRGMQRQPGAFLLYARKISRGHRHPMV